MSAAGSDRLERFKEAMRQDWTANAVGWRAEQARHAVTSRAATEAIIAAAGARPGLRVLDLASGAGQPALALAERVAPDGHVTATDLVPEMLAVAEAAARAQGLTNISFQQADAEALPFADQSFDVVTCRFGVMFFPDVGQALREVYRVLRPGGRAVFMAQGPVDQNPYFAMMDAIARKYAPAPPRDPDAPDRHRFAAPERLADALRAAGFRDVLAEHRALPWPIPGGPEQVWESCRVQNRLLRQLAAERSPAQLEPVRQDVLAMSEPYYDGQQVRFTAVVVLAVGTR